VEHAGNSISSCCSRHEHLTTRRCCTCSSGSRLMLSWCHARAAAAPGCCWHSQRRLTVGCIYYDGWL
jgi:hypothetical protein